MKLVIERNELVRALGHVASVVEKRTTIPILSNVMLRASGQTLLLKATDLEREVLEQAPASVQQPGAVTVSAHTIHDIVRKLPDGAEIELKKDPDKDRLTITAGQSRFALQTLPPEDFPDLSGGDFPHTFELPAHDLRRLIDKTRFAISTEETRYYLNGIFLHIAQTGGQSTLRAVATDGHRLAQLDLDRPSGAEGMAGVIVPRKTVHEVHRLAESGDGTVTVAVSPTKIRFEIGTVTLTSKLIDGTFPDYSRVIPVNNDKLLRVASSEFIQAVDRVATIATERGRAVKLAIDKSTLTLSVNNAEGGSATEEMDVEFGGQGALEIGFNARYLLDIAGQLDSGTAHFKLADAAAPAVIRDGDDTTALYVLMPMRV
jgi:DNA polymerase-3 subunit beta